MCAVPPPTVSIDRRCRFDTERRTHGRRALWVVRSLGANDRSRQSTIQLDGGRGSADTTSSVVAAAAAVVQQSYDVLCTSIDQSQLNQL